MSQASAGEGNVTLGKAKLSGIGRKSHGNWRKGKSEGVIVSPPHPSPCLVAGTS